MGGRNNIEDSIEGLAGLGVICFEVVSSNTTICFSPFGIHWHPTWVFEVEAEKKCRGPRNRKLC